MKNREITLAIAAATVVLAFALYPFVPQEMIPLGDSGQFTATIELEAGAFFERTNKVAQQFESILLEQPEVEKVSSNVGFEITRNSTYFSRYSMGSVNTASSVVTLKYLNDCDKPNGMTSQRDIWQIMDGVEDKARRTISGLRRIAIKEMGVDVMATSAAPIQIAVYGEDLDILYLSQNIN